MCPHPRHHRQPGPGQRGGRSPAVRQRHDGSSSPWTMGTYSRRSRATRPASRRRPSPFVAIGTAIGTAIDTVGTLEGASHPFGFVRPDVVHAPRARGDDHPRHAVVPSPDARRPAVAVRPREVRRTAASGRTPSPPLPDLDARTTRFARTREGRSSKTRKRPRATPPSKPTEGAHQRGRGG